MGDNNPCTFDAHFQVGWRRRRLDSIHQCSYLQTWLSWRVAAQSRSECIAANLDELRIEHLRLQSSNFSTSDEYDGPAAYELLEVQVLSGLVVVDPTRRPTDLLPCVTRNGLRDGELFEIIKAEFKNRFTYQAAPFGKCNCVYCCFWVKVGSNLPNGDFTDDTIFNVSSRNTKRYVEVVGEKAMSITS